MQTLTSGGNNNGAPQNPYAFHARIKDPGSGLVKFGLRWYNPITGTWTQQDTLDAPLDPANANRYAYAGDDPINNLDPTGLLSYDCIESIVLLALASAAILGTIALAAAAVLSGGALAPLDTVVALFTIPAEFGAVDAFTRAC